MRNNGKECAAKFESKKAKNKMLDYEMKLMVYMRGEQGFPRVHFYGEIGEYRVMVMDLLGINLEEQFKKMNRRFTLRTVLKIGL